MTEFRASRDPCMRRGTHPPLHMCCYSTSSTANLTSTSKRCLQSVLRIWASLSQLLCHFKCSRDLPVVVEEIRNVYSEWKWFRKESKQLAPYNKVQEVKARGGATVRLSLPTAPSTAPLSLVDAASTPPLHQARHDG